MEFGDSIAHFLKLKAPISTQSASNRLGNTTKSLKNTLNTDPLVDDRTLS